MGDRGRIYTGSFLRALANGLAGVFLGIYLAKLGHSVVILGLVLSAGLAGATLATAAVTFYGDSLRAGLKIAYDVMLYAAFRRVRPPEER